MDFGGKIVKALSGFYYVRTPDGRIVECRARGKFRKEHLSPLVGDEVECSREGGRGMIERVLPRRNAFVRPAVSNLDALVIFASETNPVTDPFLIDRVSAIAGNQGVPVLLCINKIDLSDCGRLYEIYTGAGFEVFRTSAVSGEGIEALAARIRGKTVAFTGNSGVGKSSVLNRIAPDFAAKTGEVSEKLGRGRHTTRHVELCSLADGTGLIDTPGFSSFDTDQMEIILKENLQYSFPDFEPYLGKCRFDDCSHRKEPDCAVRGAVEAGEIEPSRYDSYLRLYEKSSQVKLWEIK